MKNSTLKFKFIIVGLISIIFILSFHLYNIETHKYEETPIVKELPIVDKLPYYNIRKGYWVAREGYLTDELKELHPDTDPREVESARLKQIRDYVATKTPSNIPETPSNIPETPSKDLPYYDTRKGHWVSPLSELPTALKMAAPDTDPENIEAGRKGLMRFNDLKPRTGK